MDCRWLDWGMFPGGGTDGWSLLDCGMYTNSAGCTSEDDWNERRQEEAQQEVDETALL